MARSRASLSIFSRRTARRLPVSTPWNFQNGRAPIVVARRKWIPGTRCFEHAGNLPRTRSFMSSPPEPPPPFLSLSLSLSSLVPYVATDSRKLRRKFQRIPDYPDDWSSLYKRVAFTYSRVRHFSSFPAKIWARGSITLLDYREIQYGCRKRHISDVENRNVSSLNRLEAQFCIDSCAIRRSFIYLIYLV